ncbi:MAG: hypothetical protein FWD68_09855 [Alphaproteobacteria bacterium]|nr:hypothetical protein [Alphaproteobacteria bacterium]
MQYIFLTEAERARKRVENFEDRAILRMLNEIIDAKIEANNIKIEAIKAMIKAKNIEIEAIKASIKRKQQRKRPRPSADNPAAPPSTEPDLPISQNTLFP